MKQFKEHRILIFFCSVLFRTIFFSLSIFEKQYIPRIKKKAFHYISMCISPYNKIWRNLFSHSLTLNSFTLHFHTHARFFSIPVFSLPLSFSLLPFFLHISLFTPLLHTFCSSSHSHATHLHAFYLSYIAFMHTPFFPSTFSPNSILFSSLFFHIPLLLLFISLYLSSSLSYLYFPQSFHFSVFPSL